MIAPAQSPRTCVVPCAHGIHLRVAVRIATAAQKFESDVWLRAGDAQANAKSILGILGLGVRQGTPVTVIARGPDAREVVDTIGTFFELTATPCGQPATSVSKPLSVQ